MLIVFRQIQLLKCINDVRILRCFRFLKQELNFSHFLSLNENDIQVIMYMTMITAMLTMIYKKENEIGYKTAVRRMGIELETLTIAIAVVLSGGDLKKVNLDSP